MATRTTAPTCRPTRTSAPAGLRSTAPIAPPPSTQPGKRPAHARLADRPGGPQCLGKVADPQLLEQPAHVGDVSVIASLGRQAIPRLAVRPLQGLDPLHELAVAPGSLSQLVEADAHRLEVAAQVEEALEADQWHEAGAGEPAELREHVVDGGLEGRSPSGPGAGR